MTRLRARRGADHQRACWRLDVAGLGGYAMWDQHVYFAGTLYRSDHIGDTQPTTGSAVQ
jgi:hypothetical protein